MTTHPLLVLKIEAGQVQIRPDLFTPGSHLIHPPSFLKIAPPHFQ